MLFKYYLNCLWRQVTGTEAFEVRSTLYWLTGDTLKELGEGLPRFKLFKIKTLSSFSFQFSCRSFFHTVNNTKSQYVSIIWATSAAFCSQPQFQFTSIHIQIIQINNVLIDEATNNNNIDDTELCKMWRLETWSVRKIAQLAKTCSRDQLNTLLIMIATWQLFSC